MTKRNSFSEGIADYLSTRERPASMSSLFGSSENIEEEIQHFRTRASTLNHLMATTPKQKKTITLERNTQLSPTNRKYETSSKSQTKDNSKSKFQKKRDRKIELSKKDIEKDLTLPQSKNYILKLFNKIKS